MLQLSPPHILKRIAVEHAIHTFKTPFVAVLASVDNNFTIYLWYQIVKQAEITINFQQTSRTNPRLLEDAQISGTFHSNATSMAPPGGENITHEKPNQCATRSKHGLSG